MTRKKTADTAKDSAIITLVVQCSNAARRRNNLEAAGEDSTDARNECGAIMGILSKLRPTSPIDLRAMVVLLRALFGKKTSASEMKNLGRQEAEFVAAMLDLLCELA